MRRLMHIIVVLLLLCSTSVGSKEPLLIVGSSTFHDIVYVSLAREMAAAANTNVHCISTGSGLGLLGLINNRADITAISSPLEDVKRSLKTKNPAIEIPDNLNYQKIGEDHIVLIKHWSNNVEITDPEIVRKIYEGEITNWKQLGGRDRPIAVYAAKPLSGTNTAFRQWLLNGRTFEPHVTRLGDNRSVILEVSNNPNGIAFVSKYFLYIKQGKIDLFDLPAITRDIGLVTMGTPRPAAQQLIDFLLSPYGQERVFESISD